MFLEGTDTVGLELFFQWLHACVTMVDAGVHFHEDISAVVAVRTLSAAVYGLFPAEASTTGRVTKAQLRSLRDASFRWPGEEAVHPETLPALAKNIAKNFMDHFFKGEGRANVQREVECMKPQVTVRFSSIALLLRFIICSQFLVVVQLQAKADAIAEPILKEVALKPTAGEGPVGGGGQPGGTAVPPSGEDGRGAADGAPAPEDQTRASSSHPSAGKV
jgi:hypothetical protein